MVKALLLFFLSSLALADIPQSVLDLEKISDRNSEAYTFGAWAARMDTLHSAKAALDGKDSSAALKITSAAMRIMPHDNEIRALRTKSLETFINITKAVKDCDVLRKRLEFLNGYAPDAAISIENNCPKTEGISTVEPTLLKELEEKYQANLPKTLKYYVSKTHEFPYDDALINAFMLFVAQQEGNFSEQAKKYCTYLEDLLKVPGGTKMIHCVYGGESFPTTTEIYQTYEKAFDNSAFEKDLPTFTVPEPRDLKKVDLHRTFALYRKYFAASAKAGDREALLRKLKGSVSVSAGASALPSGTPSPSAP